MTIIQSFSERHIHTNTQRTNKVLILIAVVYKAMDHLDFTTTFIYIQTNNEWQPFPTLFIYMDTF